MFGASGLFDPSSECGRRNPCLEDLCYSDSMHHYVKLCKKNVMLEAKSNVGGAVEGEVDIEMDKMEERESRGVRSRGEWGVVRGSNA